MSNDFTISVIIPAYNAEQYLHRSIKSALAQTFSSMEIIVVDDGSFDKTAKIAREYKNKITYIYQSNAGAGAARNTGIKNSRGDWIAFLDVDDEWRSHHLANAVKVLSAAPQLKWYGAPVNQYLHETGLLIAEQRKKKPGILVKDIYFEDYLVAFPPYAHFSTPTMVIHRSVFNEVGLFDIKKRTGEDIDMWFRIGLQFPKVGYCHEVGANIYKRSSSLSYTKKIDYKNGLITIREREQLAESLGVMHRVRAEPRIVFWITRMLKASLSKGDTAAVRAIAEIYGHRLLPRWRWLFRIYLAAPWFIRPLFALRKNLSRKQRALHINGLK
jgi:glycosyltransferase involved in cell wall biosynthesis